MLTSLIETNDASTTARRHPNVVFLYTVYCYIDTDITPVSVEARWDQLSKSDITVAMHHKLYGTSAYELNSHRKGDEHPLHSCSHFTCLLNSPVAFADNRCGMTIVTDNGHVFRSSCHRLRCSSKLGLQWCQRSKVLATEWTLDSCLACWPQLVLCPYLHALDMHAVAAAISVNSTYKTDTVNQVQRKGS